MNKSQYAVICIAFALVPIYGIADEIIHDPEFVRMEKEFSKQWNADDALVIEKLNELEERFGKKPNIVYILADDVGIRN